MSENNSANQTPCWRFDSIPAGGMERASITGEFFSKNTPLESEQYIIGALLKGPAPRVSPLRS